MNNRSSFPLLHPGLLLLLAAGFLPLAAAQEIVINEIHYDPPDNTRGEEFVELFNAGDSAVDLSGWFFSNGIDFTFPPGTTMAPETYLVIAEDAAGFTRRFGRAPFSFFGSISARSFQKKEEACRQILAQRSPRCEFLFASLMKDFAGCIEA